jgi:NAD(P)-dependent dehydrogenase (short-subunit alcohol dehydrogenase family)
MKKIKGRLAVVTGAGTGMGRELSKQLASEGCNLAICDIIVENMLETKKMCEELAPPGTLISAHVCDVSDESQVLAFRDAVKQQHKTGHIGNSIAVNTRKALGLPAPAEMSAELFEDMLEEATEILTKKIPTEVTIA